MVADRGQLFGADAAGEAMQLLGEREHQRDGELGAGDIGAAPDGQHLDAFRGTGGEVDVARLEAVLLHDSKCAAGGKLGLADLERFDDQGGAAGQCRAHSSCALDQPHLARKELPGPRTHAPAVVIEVGLVVGEEIGVGRVTFGRGVANRARRR